MISKESVGSLIKIVGMGKNHDEFVKKIAAEITAEVIEKLSQSKTIPIFELSEDEKQNYHDFIRIMGEVGWPAFMDSDFDFHKKIIELHSYGLHSEIEEAIFEHYDAAYITYVLECLCESPIIKKERYPIFEEALSLYNLGYYYGCVALLMTQIAGMIKDIDNYVKQNENSFKPENEKLLSTRYGITKTKEKGRLIAILLEGKDENDEQGEYNYLIGYFRFKIFGDSLDTSELTTQSNRNMIFHGEQLTFGSKEQALKLILCVDALSWVAEILHDR